MEDFPEALRAFDKASNLPDIADGVNETDLLTYRGIAKQKAGKNGYVKDIKDAASKGGKKAKHILKSLNK